MIADAARTLPHTLRQVDTGDDTLAELEVLVGYDDDLAGEVTRIANRIRGLLTQIHPPLERVLGPKVQHPAVLEALSRCGGPAGIRKAGRAKLTEIIKKRAPRMGPRLVDQIFTALDAPSFPSPDLDARYRRQSRPKPCRRRHRSSNPPSRHRTWRAHQDRDSR